MEKSKRSIFESQCPPIRRSELGQSLTYLFLHLFMKYQVKDLQAAKSKTTFKSVAEVDAQIARLEAQVEAGSMKLAEEKRALTEISTLRRSKRNVEGLATQQAAIDADRAKADELRAGLDDPESKAVSKRYDEIKNELETLQKEHEKTAGSRSKLVEQRVAASAKLDALYATKRERQSTFRSEMDRYFTKVNAEKEKRNERFKEEKKKEELEKKKAHEQQLREEAALPAFSKEIEDCDVLINYFSGASSSSTTSTTKPSTVSEKQSLGKKLELRTVGNDENVPEGAKVAKKKGGEDEEDAFFVGSSKKSSKKNKGKSKGTPLALGESPSDEQPSGSANGSSGGPALHVPLGTLSALLALSIPPPTSQSDTTRVVENLRLKREYFVSNQERKTKENIEKVEKLLAKNGTASDEVDDKAQDEANKAPVANGNEHSSSEEKVAEKEEEKKDEE